MSGRQGTELALQSDLKGLTVSLPQPFAKTAEEARTLTLQIARLGADNESTTATFAGGISGRFNRIASPAGERSATRGSRRRRFWAAASRASSGPRSSMAC